MGLCDFARQLRCRLSYNEKKHFTTSFVRKLKNVFSGYSGLVRQTVFIERFSNARYIDFLLT